MTARVMGIPLVFMVVSFGFVLEEERGQRALLGIVDRSAGGPRTP